MKWILGMVFIMLFAQGKAQEAIRKEAKLANYEERLNYYLSSRQTTGNKNIAALKRDAYNQVQKQKENTEARVHTGDWEMNGPVYIEDYEGSGRVNRLAFHPTDPDVIYAATAGGGLWRTPNHGIVWYPMTTGIPSTNLSGVALDPTNADVVYILTGDGDGENTSASSSYSFTKSSIGVLKTTDSGNIWRPSGLKFDESLNVRPYELKMSPVNPLVLYVSTNQGLFRTIDGGVSWDTLSPNLIYEVEFKPGTPTTMYAVDNDNFYKSTNGGNTWPDTFSIAPIQEQARRMTISVTPANPAVVHLLASPQIDSSEVHRGIYYSNTSGDSFSLMNTDSLIQKGGQGDYDLAIATSFDNANELVTGCVTIFGSTNNGTTIESRGGTHADIHELIVNPLDGFLYAATDGGVFYSENFGEDWTFISEWMNTMQYYKIAIGQTSADLVIGGAQDNGTHRNTNGDAVFDKIGSKDGMDCAIHPSDDNLMIFSAQFGEFWISMDGGNTKDSLINISNIEDAQSIWVTPVAWDPQDSSDIFIGSNPVYRSLNLGASFSPITDTVGGRRVLHSGINNRVYAGDRYTVSENRESHLWTSINDGGSWTAIHTNPGFPSLSLVHTGITTNPFDDEVVWLSLGGWEDGEKVYSSDDGGATWNNRSGTLPNVPVNCIIYQGANSVASNAVYIGTDIGVFYRDDALGDWIYFSNGLPVVEVADLEIRVNAGKLVAGTYGRGVWESDLYTACPENVYLDGFFMNTKKNYFFQASDLIEVENYTIEGFGSSLILKAGDIITLKDGFVALSGNGEFFKARTGPCSGGVESITTSESDSEANKE